MLEMVTNEKQQKNCRPPHNSIKLDTFFDSSNEVLLRFYLSYI